jgi:hypothetical protein
MVTGLLTVKLNKSMKISLPKVTNMRKRTIRDWIFRERNTEEGDWLGIPGAHRRHPACDGKDKLRGENQ